MADQTSSLYLSSLVTNKAGELQSWRHVLSQEQASHPSDIGDGRDFPLHALHREYKIDQADLGHQADPSLLQCQLPVSPDQTMSDLATTAVGQLLFNSEYQAKKSHFLFFCHETTEANLTLTPTLKVKKLCQLKGTTPFSISHTGSCGPIQSLNLIPMLKATLPADEPMQAIMVVADQLCPPHPRSFYHLYPKGDASAACLLHESEGDWQVVDHWLESWPLPLDNPYLWDEMVFSIFETEFYRRYPLRLAEFIDRNQIQMEQISFVIPQQISERFVSVTENLFSRKAPVYRRSYAPQSNLLGSDCFFSLHEASQEGRFCPGDLVLLIQAGPLASLGFLLLQRTNQ
ncbi:hypothetical protein [Paenibacillus sp.]|uniref:hypothetical protein n=1 Tax=Paenibacillus sp. TaxID=58172 RepID=UPI002835C8C8|nr:hypothetical protein [Paenibacillus sp.]MDR0267467.1 hypothetical protein [Paenibacillus sp.]